MIKQVYEHGKKLYSHIKGMFDNSFATLQAEKGRHRTMEIDLPNSIDTHGESRVSDFVSIELEKLCSSASGGFDFAQLPDIINKSFSDRNIVNALCNKSTYNIKVCKVKQVAENSSLVSWEAAHSGGERFLTYFIIFAALTAYTRKNEIGESRSANRSVFLSDNPFGSISSHHLLNALAVVARKYHLQLVCFTAIDQSSIANEFDLIYQLTMRKAIYSNNSYLITEEEIKNRDDLNINSNLEYISVRSQQTSLFD